MQMHHAALLILISLPTILISEPLEGDIGHECGIALVRLKKPLQDYIESHGDIAWGLRMTCGIMEAQRNRGQDGAGLAVVKFDMPAGEKYIQRTRAAGTNSIDEIFSKTLTTLPGLPQQLLRTDTQLKTEYQFLGEVYLGHVRYGTYGGNSIECAQPYLCKNNVMTKNFALAGNFNMTNTTGLFEKLIECGINPTNCSDTQVILQGLGWCLEEEHTYLSNDLHFHPLRTNLNQQEHAQAISHNLDLIRMLRKGAQFWDGGYLFAGVIGNGDVFICRDPAGIRPGFYYENDEVFAVASERSALCNVFNVEPDDVHPIIPGSAIVIKQNGTIIHDQFTQSIIRRECMFERIYFSRNCDPDIYNERKELGKNIAECVLDALEGDIENAVFTYIPNSSETAFLGLIEEIQRLTNKFPRAEKIIHKNQKVRTFIAADASRKNMVAQLYDVTKGIVKPTDTLIALDDSIVRGTTLRESILTRLSQLNPKRIIIISAAPPVLYPDCYGIDMSQLERFIAFQAAVELCKEQGMISMLDAIAHGCNAQQHTHNPTNLIKQIYAPWSLEQLSDKIAQLVRPNNMEWSGEITIIFQSVEDMHRAIPNYTGDWYFTGNYPTPGGYQVLNRSYLNWFEHVDSRSY